MESSVTLRVSDPLAPGESALGPKVPGPLCQALRANQVSLMGLDLVDGNPEAIVIINADDVVANLEPTRGDVVIVDLGLQGIVGRLTELWLLDGLKSAPDQGLAASTGFGAVITVPHPILFGPKAVGCGGHHD
jgi:hypothetical protein